MGQRASFSFTAAAEILAQSNEPFETVVLKFLSTETDRRMGLKVLLEKKLDKLGTGNEERMKRDALVMWLMEIQLAELAEARRTGDTQAISDLTDHLQHFILKKNNLVRRIVTETALSLGMHPQSQRSYLPTDRLSCRL